MPRDYYEVLGVDRGAGEARSRRPSAGSRASCTPTSTGTTPRPRRSSRRPPRPTRSSPTPSAAAPTTPSATRACARAAGRRARAASAASRTCFRVLRRGDPLFSELFGFGRAGPRAAATSAARVEVEPRGGAHRRQARGLLRGGLDLRALPRQRRRAGDADPHLRDLRRQRRAARGGADRRSARWSATGACPTCGGDGRVARDSPARSATARAATVRARTWEVEVPPGIESGQRIRISGAGHAGEAGGPAGDLYVRGAGRRGRALRAPRPGPRHGRSTSPPPGRCSAAR